MERFATSSLDLEFLERPGKIFWHGKELSNTTIFLRVLQKLSSQSHPSSCDSTTATSGRKKLQIFKNLSLVPQALTTDSDKWTKHRINIFDKVNTRVVIKEARKTTKFWNSYLSYLAYVLPQLDFFFKLLF